MRRTTHNIPCVIEGVSNNEDIFSDVSSYYEDLSLLIPLNDQKTIHNNICNECINNTVNVNDVENSIKRTKTWRKCLIR